MPEPDFEQFVQMERSALIWFLMSRYQASAHDAEEAAQTALLRAWQRWSTIDNPRAWVQVVAGNEYAQSAARQAAHRTCELDEDILKQMDAPHTPSAAERIVLSEQEQLICDELAKLPPTQRLVAELRYQGHSNSEIADQLGVDPSAVRHNMKRARSRLRHLRDLIQEDA